MLVCSISQPRPHAIITVDLAESANAQDTETTSSVIFAAIVDDPAAVADFVDAYFGDPIAEAASAAAVVNAGLLYVTAITESAHAADLVDAVRSLAAAAVTESAHAADVIDSAVGAIGALIAETVTATDAPDATRITGTHSRMVVGDMINTGASRQVQTEFIMINQ